jgi:hypothetical protein
VMRKPDSTKKTLTEMIPPVAHPRSEWLAMIPTIDTARMPSRARLRPAPPPGGSVAAGAVEGAGGGHGEAPAPAPGNVSVGVVTPLTWVDPAPEGMMPPPF